MEKILLYEALGWDLPAFAHIPLIHGSDGAKLSKRHGALGVEAYRDMGYLPEALSNYLLRLGWSHGDEEIIPQDKAKEWFNLEAVNKAPSRLDLDKLDYINSHYLNTLSSEQLVQMSLPFFDEEGVELTLEQRDSILRAAPFLKERVKTLKAVVDAAKFITETRPFTLEGKAAKPLKKEGAQEIIREIHRLISSADSWQAEALDQTLKAFVEEKQIGFGKMGQPVRAALTAGHPSPSLGEIMFSLGQAETLARLADQLPE